MCISIYTSICTYIKIKRNIEWKSNHGLGWLTIHQICKHQAIFQYIDIWIGMVNYPTIDSNIKQYIHISHGIDGP